MPSCGWIGPCTPTRARRRAGLVLKQVDGVAGVVPQQVIRPASRLAERVRVRAAEKVRLHVHLLDRQLALGDAVVDPLVAGVEPPRVAAHADDARLPLDLHHPLRVGEVVRDRNLDLTCLPARITARPARRASASASRGSPPRRLRSPASRRGRPSSAGCSTSSQPRRFRGGRRRARRPRRRRCCEPFEVLDAERALSGQGDLHRATACSASSGLSSSFGMPNSSRVSASALRQSRVLQDQVAHRGVRRRHVIVAVHFFRVVGERAAHDQPHHHLDPFGPRLAHVVDVRQLTRLADRW